ncbi:hypothetical protein CJF42_25400 [Pseudoalteromonas sp. NBT06-2]|uniref:hypothetical protein n=1 Tax=Pseudoalteromonas sp. NBT06-2 TaxID=2025950 RepID=UPI000BA64E4F|nr:hypothetical protein [Pseudoalteromonas sp. NBT06-2]PAJ71681.1 hypothetical protein CJF42_25400 [Pseudoalteromonas sp. NBT06-2]
MIKHIVTSLMLLPTSLLANTDVISVTDFGADGTDSLPDHVAFKNAINPTFRSIFRNKFLDRCCPCN